MDIDKPRPDLENDLTAVERRLAAWRPAAALDRDRMLFHAGRAAAQAEEPGPLLAARDGGILVVTVTSAGCWHTSGRSGLPLESQDRRPNGRREPRSSTPTSPRFAQDRAGWAGSYLALTTQARQRRSRLVVARHRLRTQAAPAAAGPIEVVTTIRAVAAHRPQTRPRS